MNRVINFSPPDIGDAEIAEVIDTLKSGWITTGPKTKKFEKELATYFGTEKVLCLNSATAALEMALRLLGVGKGDEVIVPAYTYTASASVIEHVGATIRMVDVEEGTYHFDYDKLHDAINEKTKVIIPVDLAGTPCNYEKIFEVVDKNKDKFKADSLIQKAFNRVIVMADAAHAAGACYNGKMVGNIADFTAFSFHAVKNLTTAEGGAITWKKIEGFDSEEIYRQLNIISLHGQTKDALAKTKPGSWEYDIVTTGYKCNMTDIMSAIGIAQLHRYGDLLKRRKEIVAKYNKAMKNLNVDTMQYIGNNFESSYHLYLIRIPGIDEAKRNKIIEMMGSKGVACNVHYKPLAMLTAYKNLGFDIEDYPNSYNQYKNQITLPLHTLLSDEDIDYVIESLRECLDELR